jgi:hypothetical protein
VICRALVSIFAHPVLRNALAFRGGTALNCPDVAMRDPSGPFAELPFLIRIFYILTKIS